MNKQATISSRAASDEPLSVSQPPIHREWRINRFERFLFPRSQWVNFVVIALLSTALSFALVGRQVFLANWGLIDDHEVFHFLGPNLHLPISDIWNTLLEKTEVGTLQGRFRPGYYLIKLLETALLGTNVHLWYLGNTIGFAIFLSSVWWALRRFVGGWLSGVLTLSIALLPLWSGIWSRLGPSEIGGAACLGIMIFASDFIFFSKGRMARNSSAIVLALATIVIVDMKETFIPLALGTAAAFVVAAIQKKLSPLLICVLAVPILACIGGIVFVVIKETASGRDFYGVPAGPWITIKYGMVGVLDALLRTWWLFVLPIALLRNLHLVPRKTFGQWISVSREAVGAYCFLIAMYAAQCALYRSSFPHHSRYDFPAMLLVPLTCCILASEISRKARLNVSERTFQYAQLTVAGFLLFALITAHLGQAPALIIKVQTNIKVTNAFYNELQRLVQAASAAPIKPIILDAYGPYTYEPVYSLSSYLAALGVHNRVSVRFHPDETLQGTFYDSLQHQLSQLQDASTGAFDPLREALVNGSHGCLSVGIEGPPDSSCSGFRLQVGPL